VQLKKAHFGRHKGPIRNFKLTGKGGGEKKNKKPKPTKKGKVAWENMKGGEERKFEDKKHWSDRWDNQNEKGSVE